MQQSWCCAETPGSTSDGDSAPPMAGVCLCFSPWTNDRIVQAHTVAQYRPKYLPREHRLPESYPKSLP